MTKKIMRAIAWVMIELLVIAAFLGMSAFICEYAYAVLEDWTIDAGDGAIPMALTFTVARWSVMAREYWLSTKK